MSVAEAMKAITDCAKKLVEEEALKQYEAPTGSIKIWDLPQGYVFKDENGNVINATKIVLEKKKKEYPKTYEECCKVLEIEGNSLLINTKHITEYERDLGNLVGQLHRLIICRDAYWKIAGREMGLNRPWEPDWLDDDVIKYIISHDGKTFGTRGGLNYINYILAFPTEEMRDAFYENFKELINECKEVAMMKEILTRYNDEIMRHIVARRRAAQDEVCRIMRESRKRVIIQMARSWGRTSFNSNIMMMEQVRKKRTETLSNFKK